MGKSAPRLLELRQFDLLKLKKVDVLESKFEVEFFCLLAFPGGATDEHLMKLDKNDDGSYKFSFGEDGKPNWLPSAGWFCDQLDVSVPVLLESLFTLAAELITHKGACFYYDLWRSTPSRHPYAADQ